MTTYTFIDPPEGWQYGFPKEFEGDPESDLAPWLVANGYPQALIDRYGRSLLCRILETDAPVQAAKLRGRP